MNSYDSSLSTHVQTLWASFARTGTPSAPGAPHWPAVSSDMKQPIDTMRIGGNTLVSDYRADDCQFWDDLEV